MTSPDQLTRFRDVPNPAFRRVAANIATTGRSQVPGHTDVIATDVDPTLTPGQDEKCYRLYGVSWGFLHEIQCGLPWHHTKLLERNKKQTSLVSKSLKILLSLNQRNQLQTSMAIETSPVQVSSVLQSQGQDLDTQQDLQGLRCHQRPNPQGVGENGKCREMGKK